jgi:starch-binding outer membrane protein, SusD/RagB family
MTMRTRNETGGRRRLWPGLAGLAAIAILTTACDLEVFSPATVDEASLDTHNAIEALWSGALGQVSHLGPGQAGAGGLFTFGALRTDELVHSGHPNGPTDNFGPLPHLRAYSDGLPIEPHWDAVEDLWNQAMMTRYVADFGVQRSREIYNAFADDPVANVRDKVTRDRIRMHAWAGVAYRLLGDHLCHAVIDGGPMQPREVYYERALAALNDGIAFAEANQVLDVDEFGTTAAYAVRAQINMLLGNWEAAEADAGRVVTGYGGLQTEHTDTEAAFRQRLYLRWLDYLEDRHMTVWGTPFLEWGWNTSQSAGFRNDYRVTYSRHRTNANPHREWGTDQRRIWRRQTKELSIYGSLRLAKGTEMRLIESEAMLRRGDWQGAINKINELREWWNAPTGGRLERDGRPLDMLEMPASQEEAWELLMRERGIELWLEGRRLADIRRWQVDPGFVPFTVVRETTTGDAENDPRRNVLDIQGDFCIPVSATERRLNPNL